MFLKEKILNQLGNYLAKQKKKEDKGRYRIIGIHFARLFLSSTYNRETNNNVKVNNNARTLYEDCVC